MTIDPELLITLGAIIVLLVISAFFSGSETALTATSRARIHELERQGDRRAGIVARLVAAPERLISSILLGNNFVNVLAAALATNALLSLFGDVGLVYATFAMTALILIFSEVLPKTYAFTNPERVALGVAAPLRIIIAVLAPIAAGVQFIVRATLKAFGISIDADRRVLSARDELRGAIDLHLREGGVVKGDRDMLGGVLALPDLEISDVMIHRTKMVSVNIEQPPADIIKTVLDTGHSRLPVWQGEPENIVGILHAKDLLAGLARARGKNEKISIRRLCAKPWFVPDITPVSEQLNAFLKRKTPLAIVVDEYGEMMGLVTLEDILEEIVGEIADEHDEAFTGIDRLANGAVIAEGTLAVRDLNRAMDWSLPEDEATTVAGLVIHEAQMIPDTGQAFTFHGFRFEVMARERNQLTSIKVTPLSPA